MGDVFSQIMVSCLYMSKEYQQRKENPIPVPPITKGFLILVPRGSFSFAHVVGDFKSSSTRAEN